MSCFHEVNDLKRQVLWLLLLSGRSIIYRRDADSEGGKYSSLKHFIFFVQENSYVKYQLFPSCFATVTDS